MTFIVENIFLSFQLQQNTLDKATPHMGFRWCMTLLLFALYFLRVYFLQVRHFQIDITLAGLHNH